MAAQAGFYLQVERCRALADSATGVIVASMAGAIVASELSSVGNGDAAKVGAHAQDDQPFRILNSLGIRLRIPKGSRVHRCNISNLLGGPVSDEQRLATPLEGHVLALRDVTKLHFTSVWSTSSSTTYRLLYFPSRNQ